MAPKRPFLSKILILAVSLSLLGCGTDDLPPSRANGALARDAKDFQNPIQIMGLKELGDGAQVRELLSHLSTTDVNAAGKSGLPDVYGFTVDTARIKAMVHGGDSSYTFLARREGGDGSFFENLVLQRTGEEGEFEAFLVRYHADRGIRSLEGHASFAFEGRREVFPLEVDKLDLGTATKETICYTLVEVWCSYQGDHPAGEMCHAEAARTGDGRIYERNSTVCVSTGGGGGTTDPVPGDGPGGGGGGPDDTYIVTAPANLDLYDWDQKYFEREKLDVERAYYRSDPNIRNIVDGFLVDRGFSPAAMSEAKGHLFFARGLPLSPRQFVWYFRNRDSGKVLKLKQFLMRQGYGPAAVEFGLGAVEVWMDGGSVELEELFLESRLLANPFLLLGMDCDQIPHWQALAQHVPPQSVLNKIEQIDNNNSTLFGDFEVQYISDAEGALVNLDYFPIVIDVLPNNPNTGEQFVADEFLEYIRINLNSFVDNQLTQFFPNPHTGYNEEFLWESNNPVGAIYSLDIPSGHDGSVVCSMYGNNGHWIFTTLTMPWGLAQGLDGPHPVSGNREWNYSLNVDGSYTFFTRGVDRMESRVDVAIANYLTGGNPFSGADALWLSFQDEVQKFTNNNGGVANKVQPSINRPNWEDVKAVLLGNKAVDDIGCN